MLIVQVITHKIAQLGLPFITNTVDKASSSKFASLFKGLGGAAYLLSLLQLVILMYADHPTLLLSIPPIVLSVLFSIITFSSSEPNNDKTITRAIATIIPIYMAMGSLVNGI